MRISGKTIDQIGSKTFFINYVVHEEGFLNPFVSSFLFLGGTHYLSVALLLL